MFRLRASAIVSKGDDGRTYLYERAPVKPDCDEDGTVPDLVALTEEIDATGDEGFGEVECVE